MPSTVTGSSEYLSGILILTSTMLSRPPAQQQHAALRHLDGGKSQRRPQRVLVLESVRCNQGFTSRAKVLRNFATLGAATATQ